MLYNLYYERIKRKLWAKWQVQFDRYNNHNQSIIEPSRMATKEELELIEFINKAG